MIFPVPVSEEYFEGQYRPEKSYCTEDLYDFYQETKAGTPDISYMKNAKFAEEEYEIHIDENGIQVTVSAETGKFRALTSLRQLFLNMERKTEGGLPFAKILDKPQFANRAYMWEISSGRMPKPEMICKVVDYLAGLKYNELQIYMENFCFKYSAFPDLTEGYECLEPENIRMLDQYCKDRFIELVPCQNGFGHMTAWLAEERWSHLEVTDGQAHGGTINPLLPESLELLDQIYGSLLPHFSSDKVNICLDEAVMLGKFQLEEICEKEGCENVFMDWMNKLADLAKNKYGKKTIQFWDDMINDYPESFRRLPEGAIALEWGYDPIKSQMMEGRCMALAEKKVPFYVCPSTSTYSSFTGRFDVLSFNIRTAAEVGRKHGAQGILITEWGNIGTPNFYVWSFVPTALGGQYGWNVGIKQHGGWLKADFIHKAQQYVDENIYKAKVSRKLYQMANYYLLEPERIHGQTMCFLFVVTPLSKVDYAPFFHLEEIGEDFYFENISRYVTDIMESVQDITCEGDAADRENFALYKRQILVNARMIRLGAEYGLVKLHKQVTREKYEELCALTDQIAGEYRTLWMEENYEKGVEEFEGYLADRAKELEEYL